MQQICQKIATVNLFYAADLPKNCYINVYVFAAEFSKNYTVNFYVFAAVLPKITTINLNVFAADFPKNCYSECLHYIFENT
jgi:hypothetical protein